MKALLSFTIAFVSMLVATLLSFSALSFIELSHAMVDLISVLISSLLIRNIDTREGGFTYGKHRREIFSMMVNVGVVLATSVMGVYFSLQEMGAPSYGEGVLPLILGSVVATLAMLLVEGKYGVREHALMDSLDYVIGSISGAVILLTGLSIMNPVVSLILVGLNIYLSLPLLKRSYYVLMEKSPVDVSEVQRELMNVEPSAHHLHIWSLCEHMTVATLHVKANPQDRVWEIENRRTVIERLLKERYGIDHVTVQFEVNETDKATS